MDYVINLLSAYNIYKIYRSYSAYGIYCYSPLGLYVSHIFYTKIYSLYYTMGYIINLLSA